MAWLASIGHDMLQLESLFMSDRKSLYYTAYWQNAPQAASQLLCQVQAYMTKPSWPECKWPYQTHTHTLTQRRLCKRLSSNQCDVVQSVPADTVLKSKRDRQDA